MIVESGVRIPSGVFRSRHLRERTLSLPHYMYAAAGHVNVYPCFQFLWLYSRQLRAPTKLAHTHLFAHLLSRSTQTTPELARSRIRSSPRMATCHRAPTTASKPTGRVLNSGLSPGLSTWPPRRARARRPPRHARPRAPRARVDPPEIVRRFTTVPNTLWSYSLRRRRGCIRGGRARHPARAVLTLITPPRAPATPLEPPPPASAPAALQPSI